MQLSEALQLIYDRLIQHHGEKPSADYMQRLEQGIKELRYLEEELPKLTQTAAELVGEMKKLKGAY